MKRYEVIIPKRVAFTELEIYYVEAENEEDALNQAYEGNYEPEYEDAGDYDTLTTYDPEIKEVKNV